MWQLGGGTISYCKDRYLWVLNMTISMHAEHAVNANKKCSERIHPSRPTTHFQFDQSRLLRGAWVWLLCYFDRRVVYLISDSFRSWVRGRIFGASDVKRPVLLSDPSFRTLCDSMFNLGPHLCCRLQGAIPLKLCLRWWENTKSFPCWWWSSNFVYPVLAVPSHLFRLLSSLNVVT